MGACFCGQWSRSFARLLFKSRFRSAFGTNRREACGCPVFQILENVAPEAKLLLQHEFISRHGLFEGSCFWEDSGTGGPCSGATCFFLLARSLHTSLPAPQMNSPFLWRTERRGVRFTNRRCLVGGRDVVLRANLVLVAILVKTILRAILNSLLLFDGLSRCSQIVPLGSGRFR